MVRPLSKILQDPGVLKDLETNPATFRFKEAVSLVITMCPWAAHTSLRTEDLILKEVLEGIPINFPIGGPMSQMLNILSTSLNFTYKQVVPSDFSWGVKYPNGTWSGMVGQIFRKEADMGLGPFQVIQSRFEDVDFAVPFSFDIVSLMVARGSGAFDPWGFLMPFTASVWGAFFLALVVVSLVHFVLDFPQQQNASLIAGFGEAIFDYAKPTLGQPLNERKWRSWHHPLFGAWVLFSLLIISSYDGMVPSLMSVQHIPHPLQTIRDVLDASPKIIVEHGTSFTDILGKVPSGDIRDLDQLGKSGYYVDLREKDFLSYAHLITEEEHIQIFDTSTALVFFARSFSQTGRCEFYLARERFIPTMYSVIFQRNSPITQAVNARIHRVIEAGLYEFWMTKDTSNYTACSNPPMKVLTKDPLGIENIWGLAVVWAVGILVASIVFVLEMITAQRSTNTAKKEGLGEWEPTE